MKLHFNYFEQILHIYTYEITFACFFFKNLGFALKDPPPLQFLSSSILLCWLWRPVATLAPTREPLFLVA